MYLSRVPLVLAVAVHHVPGALVPPLLEGFELVVVSFSVLLEFSRFFLNNLHHKLFNKTHVKGVKYRRRPKRARFNYGLIRHKETASENYRRGLFPSVRRWLYLAVTQVLKVAPGAR